MIVLNILIGILLILLGILGARKLTTERKKGDKGGYGAHIRIYVGLYSLIIIGIYLIIKAL